MELADRLVSEALVQSLGPGVKRGDAWKDVWGFSEDPSLREGQQLALNVPASPLRHDADCLNVADKRAYMFKW